MILAWYRTLVNRRAVVNLTSGQAIVGVIVGRRGPLIRIRDGQLYVHGQRSPMDGEIVVERSRVAWYQVLG